MILDIVSIPIQIEAEVDMQVPLFVRNDPFRSEDESVWCMSRKLDGTALYRYKIIELVFGAVIEHIVVSFDEMNPSTLGIVGDYQTPVDIYPISSKIVSNDGKRTLVYKHRQGIQTVISKISGDPVHSMESIHHMFLNTVGAGMWKHKRLDLAKEFIDYRNSVEPRINALLTSDEEGCDTLLSRMSDIAFMLDHDFSDSCHDKFFVNLIDELSCLPTPCRVDNLSDKWFGKSHISSFDLKPYISESLLSKNVINQLITHDVFKLDDTVEYSLPEMMRWQLLPLIDKLGALPYTDLSITVDVNDLHVNYAVSMTANTIDPESIKNDASKVDIPIRKLCPSDYMLKSPSYVEGLARCLMKFAWLAKINPKQTKCTLVKTFREDVYIKFTGNEKFINYVRSSHVPTKYYLDLTMCSLGTRALIPRDFYNSSIPAHY
jgi:hypothetical protein